MTAPGVSRELARYRKGNYREVAYDLRFTVPRERGEAVRGWAGISLTLDRQLPLAVDFRGDSSSVESVHLNGEAVDYIFRDEHIIVDARETSTGENRLEIAFTPADQSLNRRDDFLYTLLVPDRARTLL